MSKVATRFAPSPTGALHIGGIRTALFNWLYSKNQKGTFHLRIEDTDKERSKDEHKVQIINSLKWIGIEHDGDENIKSDILSKSIFAVSKSGTVSLQICNANIPSIIIYKLSFINFMIFKMLVNVKFANIINIINNREIIPELLQNECNAQEIYKTVIYFLKNPELIKKQLAECNKTLDGIRSKTSSSDESSTVLSNYLVS